MYQPDKRKTKKVYQPKHLTTNGRWVVAFGGSQSWSETIEQVNLLNGDSDKPKNAPGTPPDVSLHLGAERRDWLIANGGIQPVIKRLIDDAMNNPR